MRFSEIGLFELFLGQLFFFAKIRLAKKKSQEKDKISHLIILRTGEGVLKYTCVVLQYRCMPPRLCRPIYRIFLILGNGRHTLVRTPYKTTRNIFQPPTK